MTIKTKKPKLDLTPSSWDESPWKPDLSLIEDQDSKRPETISAIAKRVPFPFKVRKIALNHESNKSAPPIGTIRTLPIGTIRTVLDAVCDGFFRVAEYSATQAPELQDSPSWEHVP